MDYSDWFESGSWSGIVSYRGQTEDLSFSIQEDPIPSQELLMPLFTPSGDIFTKAQLFPSRFSLLVFTRL